MQLGTIKAHTHCGQYVRSSPDVDVLGPQTGHVHAGRHRVEDHVDRELSTRQAKSGKEAGGSNAGARLVKVLNSTWQLVQRHSSETY